MAAVPFESIGANSVIHNPFSTFVWLYIRIVATQLVMKHLLLCIFICLSWLSCQAQIYIPTSLMPRTGDTLLTAVDNLPANIRNIGSGRNQRWDFAMLEAPYTRSTVWRAASKGSADKFFKNAEYTAPLDEQTEGYFRTEGNDLILVGAVGPDPLNLNKKSILRYSPGLVERRYGLRYGDAFQADGNLVLTLGEDEIPSWFRKKLPVSPDSLRLRVSYDRQYDADSYGRIIVPGGIFEVLREKRIEIVEMKLEVKVGRRRWQDVTRSVRDRELLRTQKRISYHFYNSKSKEPVARVWMSPNEKKVLKIEFKPREEENPVQNLASVRPDIYVSPNPAISDVRFEFFNLSPGTYKLSIYNIIGQEEWSKMYTINGNYTEQVDISKLKKGAYLYSLKDERGRTLSTKRLMVIRP